MAHLLESQTVSHREGTSRREFLRNSGHALGALQVGGWSLVASGVKSGRLDAGEASGRRPSGRAKSVILFNLLGGPSQLDMFDMKPTAPAEVRGEFTSIQTSLPGLRICEHMPKIARLMHKAALIRTVTHGYNAHNPLNIMTGWSLGNPAALRPDPNDPPDIGAVYGETDAIAAYPKSDPVSPADIVTTIYQQLGIDSHTMLPDRTGRPMPIAHGGQPIPGLT